MRPTAKATALILALLSLWALPASAQQGVTVGEPYGQWFHNDGTVCNGCKLNFYIAGTSTRLDTFTTADLSVANANPVILTSAGRAAIFLSDRAYKVTLTTSADVEIWTVDNYVGRAPPANVLSKTANYTVTTTDGKDVVISADASGGGFTVTLYTAVGNSGRRVSVVKTDASSNFVTVDANGSQTINGALTQAISIQYAALSMVSDGANWLITYETVNQDPESGGCDGRLTATTGVPVTTSDVSAATSIYLTPYQGNECWVYDGSASWQRLTFSEITISVTTCTASTPYDVFVYNNSGTLAAEILAWTNATTRATALTMVTGRYVKSGQTTRRYRGSFYCNATGGQTDDTYAKRYLWDNENRVERAMRVTEPANSWTYNSGGTLRQANGNTANQLDIMVGLAEESIEVMVFAVASNSSNNETHTVAIGEDSTTAAMSGSSIGSFFTAASGRSQGTASLRTIPAVGRHRYIWLEDATNGGGTATWYGDNNTPTLLQSAIMGMWRN